jgi:hypothetical protein
VSSCTAGSGASALLAFQRLFQPVKLALDESVRVAPALFPIFNGASRSRDARAEGRGVFVKCMAERLDALWGPCGVGGRHERYCSVLMIRDCGRSSPERIAIQGSQHA